QAEQELRMKQIAKIAKWQEIKHKMVHHIKANDECENRLSISDSKSNSKNIWTDASYPELSSLDSFMTQLKYDGLQGLEGFFR
ncbi:uncharacterized protein, partial [Fopius arisanus]|uniref:Uncharacterized protein n=1 Tax=Fopius arisanus TaxID=64838 RepID=A0A9R1T3N2_9HYME